MGGKERGRPSASTSSEGTGVGKSILRIQHPVVDLGAWKQAFDSDPVGRQKSGVRRYRVMPSTDGLGTGKTL